ncbi:MAG: terminase [Kineosporiaceae bacterium]|nr:terminase [Aeromicrobium sp.]
MTNLAHEVEKGNAEIEQLVRDIESGEYIIPDYPFEADYIGPIWSRDENDRFILPEHTIGWQGIKWAEDNLLNDKGGPWRFTAEQKRFLLWWYAVDWRGVFIFRDGILQRLKGWGKDPLAAVLCLIELLGPCRFKGWAGENNEAKGYYVGDPIARDNPTAWIQVAAVSKKQTQNTMICFGWLICDDLKKKFRIQVNKESVSAYGGNRKIEAVTSNPRSMEGGRPSLVIRNETHHWVEANEGHDMADVVERNLTKSTDGSGRALSITNAYAPHEDSVAQRQREAWEAEQAGLAVSTGVMYDSIEAPTSTSLTPPKPDKPEDLTEEEFNELYGLMTKKWHAAIVDSIRGDAHWLNVERIVLSLLDGNRSISVSKRFWLNVITTTEDAWVEYDAVKKAVSFEAADQRQFNHDELRAGWLPMPDEPIVIFGDGSKSDDSTGLVGCRLSDGYTFQIGVWQKPPKERGKQEVDSWLAPRSLVDARLREAMARFEVVAFWFDPSHAKDDTDDSSYWAGLIDEWHRDFGPKLDKRAWAVKSGARTHSVLWDMTSPERQGLFVKAAETFVEDLEATNDIEEFEPLFEICGTPALMRHLQNARMWPTKWGTSLGKEGSGSSKKIDLAVCAVGARMLRRIFMNASVDQKEERKGTVWGS